jgi:hypothetical protein
MVAWSLRSAVVVAFGLALVLAAPSFGPDADLGDMRTLWLAFGLSVAGLAYCIDVPRLIYRTQAQEAQLDASALRRLVLIVAAAGFIARAIQFAGTPIIEDDYQRYLWDGATTAHGLNPYSMSPADALLAPTNSLIRGLADQGRETVESINHPELKTIYPPVAQATFALAHAISPWSLTGWRLLCLIGELATFGLLLQLLKLTGRSPLWIALYWWNPLVIKELMNSAHMEAVLMPLVLGSLWLSARHRHAGSIALVALAAGTKLWPLLLAPLVLRPLLPTPGKLIAGAAFLCGFVALCSLPVYFGGLDTTSGFVAYAHGWKTNSALSPALEEIARITLKGVGLDNAEPEWVVRLMLSGLIGFVAIYTARRPIDNPLDLMTRSALVVAALVICSPAQFPWYMVWVMPFLVFLPVWGLLATTAFVPIFYSAFHFLEVDAYPIYRDTMVWLVWIPVWGLLIAEFLLNTRKRSSVRDTAGSP